MVNNPLHDVNSVRKAARDGKVHFADRNVERVATGEGFSHDDVCKCVSEVTVDSYKTTISYENSPTPFDVYVHQFQGRAIYLKLKLTCAGLVVVLASFHESNYSI